MKYLFNYSKKIFPLFIFLISSTCLFGQTVYNYNYTGAVQTVTLQPGDYQFEVWGAQGGGTGGGKGGYSKGVINITQPTIYYIYVGELGITNSSRGSGGGGTDIRTSSNEIWYDNLNSRIIVAGGGGGGNSTGYGGYGGGTSGGNGMFNNSSQGGQFGYGANSSTVGGVDPGDEGLDNCLGGMSGSFGYGGDSRYSGRGNTCTDSNFYPSRTSWQYRDLYGAYNGGGTYDVRGGESSGGGGGYFGGGAPGSGDYGGGGGGGSGYVSSSVFTGIQLIAGNASMPNPSGGTMTGRSGDGYARIVQLSSGGTISSSTSVFCTSNIDPVAFTSSAVADGGSGIFTYQWEESSDGTNFTDISGATSETYDPGLLSQTTYFRRKATNSLTLYSNVLTIEKFEITTHPNTTDQNLLLNATPTNLSVVVSNISGVTYQWYKNASNTNSGGTLISTAGTSATYTPPTSVEGNWYYYAVVTKGGCSITSNVSGLVSVNKPTPTVTFSNVTKTFGDASFSLSATSNNTSSKVYTVTDTNVATVSGNTITIVGAGSTTVTVTQVADTNYRASTTSMTLTVNKATPTVTFSNVTKTFGDASFSLSATSNNTSSKVYTITDTNVATVSGDTLSIVGAGSTTVTVTQLADANYQASTATMTLTVNKATPTVTFSNVTKTYGDASFSLSATSNSTSLMVYSVTDTNVATVSGNTITIVGAGSTTVTVTQVTDSNYQAATATMTLTVAKATPTVTFSNVTKTFGDASFSLSATSNSTIPKVYSVTDTNVATVSGNTLSIVGAGSTTVTVTQVTDSNYQAATATMTLTVAKATPTVTFSNVTKTFGDASFSLSSTSNSTSPKVYSVTDSNVATVSGNTLSIVGAGSTTVTVTQVANANYQAATATMTLTVAKATPTVTFSNVTKTFGDASFALSSTSNNTSPFVYSSGDTSVATISGNTVSIVGAGTATITASQATDSNYLATSTMAILTVNKLTPVLSNFNAISKTTDDTSFTLTTPTSSGGTGLVTYSSSNLAVATIVGNTVTITGSGSTTITATQAADANFNTQTISAQLTVGVGVTQPPILTSPLTNTSGATTLQISYTLPEAPLPGSVKLVFTPSAGGSTIVWIMDNGTSTSFAYPVGTNPTLLSNVVSGDALAFTTYNVTITYQDIFASPAVSITNTNIQTLAPPSISVAQNNYNGVINVALTPITVVNSGGFIGSFTINPALPDGLVIDSTTGNVTGIPTAELTTINYTITATNPAGSSTASFNLFIDSDSDGDSIGDRTDPDIDGDEISNISDVDINGDGFVDNGTDIDGDGINDANDTDIDGDGVPNTQEILEGTSPTTPGAKDTDGDGVPDYIEQQQGTSPTTPGAKDTDGDGVPDYIEQQQGTSPTTPGAQDIDGDGVPDYIEVQQGTSPTAPGAKDTDGDGVPDYIELLQGTSPTTPDVKDTDGDGVPDYIELQQGTSPNLAGDGLDSDGDGLSDYNEGYVFSNPQKSLDIDNNGTPDYLEFNNHSASEDDLEVFNSITNNDDNLNDAFIIRGIENYPDNTLYIYNRWGAEVYNVEGYGQDDKYFRGLSEGRQTISQSAELPKGTYFYILRYVNKAGVEKQRSGYLYITK